MEKEFDTPFDAGSPGGTGGLSLDNPYSTTRITETAERLGILSLLVSERTVQEYLGAHNELSDLAQAMTQAREALIAKEDRSISPGIDRALQANYTQALGFNRAAILVVEDGLQVRDVYQTLRELEACFTPVLSPMGLYLDEWQPGEHRKLNGLRLREYEEANRAQRAQDEEEDANLRDELVRRTEIGFIPAGKWRISPAIQSYAEIFTAVIAAEDHILKIREGNRTETIDEDGVKTLIGKNNLRFNGVEGLVYSIHNSLAEGIVSIGSGEKHTPPYQYAMYLNMPFAWVYKREVVW